jgi:tRNA(fMet)-specific endonuclease VapC
MIRYLLDTNHLGHAISADSSVQQRLQAALLAGHRFGTCVPALCEVEVGIRQTARRQANERRLRELIAELRIWPVDLSLISVFADIRGELKNKGRVMSQIDIMVAAIARQQSAVLLTTDRDFESLPDIACENWVETR